MMRKGLSGWCRVIAAAGACVAGGISGGLGVGVAGAQTCDPVVEDVLVSPDGQATAEFGRFMDVSGDVAIVGSMPVDVGQTQTPAINWPGSVHVYRFDGSHWNHEAKLVPPGTGAFGYGTAVAISGDTAVVGAAADEGQAKLAGAVYVFHYDGQAWSFQQKLTAHDGQYRDHFGHAVAIDGDTIAVSARVDNFVRFGDIIVDNARSILYKGSVYVFAYDGSQWIEQAKILSSNPNREDSFGGNVSLSGDTLAVSASSDNVANSNSLEGSASIFHNDGSAWTMQAYIVPFDGRRKDRFGWSIALDGDRVVVGSRQDDDLKSLSGSAYVYGRTGSAWTLDQKLLASDGGARDLFGQAVAIRGDTLVVGAIKTDNACPGIGDCDSGSAYVFARDDGLGWTERVRLDAPDAQAGDLFGSTVALTGSRVLVDAYMDTNANGNQAGTVYAFDLRCQPRCPADLTGSIDPNDPGFGVPDGLADANDFFFYLGLFAAGDQTADLTGSIDPNNPAFGIPDGLIDANDFFFYLSWFGLGC